MGAASSLQPEVFSVAKDEYEAKKDAGLTDEELFNHMKAFIETKTKEIERNQNQENPNQEGSAPTAETANSNS
jgi:hypothetical protein